MVRKLSKSYIIKNLPFLGTKIDICRKFTHKFTQHTIMDVFEANWHLVHSSYDNNDVETFKTFIGKLDEQKEVKLRYIQKLLALLGYSNLSRVEYIELNTSSSSIVMI